MDAVVNAAVGPDLTQYDLDVSRASLERQNRISVFRIENDSLGSAPLFSKTTLAAPDNIRAGQTTSTIHVHPNGRFVYVGNRASATTDV